MKKRIKGKLCDTEAAILLGTKYAGEFGDTNGYEERLYISRSKQHFMYGVGGSESKYTEPTINLVTAEEAEEWKSTEKSADETVVEKKKSVTPKNKKVKKPSKPTAKKATKVKEPAEDAGVEEPKEDAKV